MSSIEELLKNLTNKIQWLDKIHADNVGFSPDNINVLDVDINYSLIEKQIIQFDPVIASEKLIHLKKILEYIGNSEIAYQAIIHNIFKIEDRVDYKEADEVLLNDIRRMNDFLESLILELNKSIPQEYYREKYLRLDFFEDLITLTDNSYQSYIVVGENKNHSEIAQQLYDLYKENRLKTQHRIDFIGNKEEIYYLLYKIAETSPQINKEAFFENKLFYLNGKNMKYSNLRKGVTNFKKKNTDKKKFIDKYFEKHIK